MIEKIGKAVLDDTCYPGQDLYSDGAIEDEMLEIARTYPKEQWNQVIAERKSWPILYHFSHVRENILSCQKNEVRSMPGDIRTAKISQYLWGIFRRSSLR